MASVCLVSGQSLRDVKDSQGDADVLMSALSAMQEKNQYLEKSLSSETRHKMDLVAALGDAKRELEISKCRLSPGVAVRVNVLPCLCGKSERL